MDSVYAVAKTFYISIVQKRPANQQQMDSAITAYPDTTCGQHITPLAVTAPSPSSSVPAFTVVTAPTTPSSVPVYPFTMVTAPNPQSHISPYLSAIFAGTSVFPSHKSIRTTSECNCPFTPLTARNDFICCTSGSTFAS